MEAALVSGILKIVGDKLVPLVLKELSSIKGVTKDLQELQALVEETKSCLQAVGYNGIRSVSPYNWLKQLKDIAYDVEDLVHEFYLEAEKHDTDVDGDKLNLAKYLHRKPKKVLLRCSTAHKIKNIKTRFAAVVKQRNDFNVIANSLLAVPAQNINKTIGESSLLRKVDETKVYGRDAVKCSIICKLINNNRREGIHIVSIVGLGGCGKTYLAKYIWQDNKVKEHFDVTFWVHVTQEFNMEKLIGKLFEAVADEKSEVRTLQYMCRTLSEILSGRKFLLVLDDVWNEDQHDWHNFEQHFNSGAPESSILLTTRNRKVAELVKSVDIIDLAFLSEDDSWKLFCQSFGLAVEDLDPEFIQTGKEIVKKCGGMPLAIKTLAGALHNKRGIEAWRAIRDSNLLNVQDLQERVSANLDAELFSSPRSSEAVFHILCYISERLHNKKGTPDCPMDSTGHCHSDK